MLLEAEEYHAGNRTVEEPPAPVKKQSTFEGRRAYARMKERKQLMGKTVKLAKVLRTQGGDEYPVGSLWEVTSYYKAGLTIRRLEKNEDGFRDSVSSVQPNDLIEVEV